MVVSVITTYYIQRIHKKQIKNYQNFNILNENKSYMNVSSLLSNLSLSNFHMYDLE